MTATVDTPAAIEQWRPVPGFPGYDVSDQGRVRSWRRRWGKQDVARILATPPRPSGHLKATLMRDGQPVHTHVHSLVAAAFLGPRPAGQEVRHLDGNPGNNRPANLRYGTTSENQYDSVRHGTHGEARKTHCDQGHAFTAENTYHPPKRPSHRQCRQCKRAAHLRRVAA